MRQQSQTGLPQTGGVQASSCGFLSELVATGGSRQERAHSKELIEEKSQGRDCLHGH